MQADIGNPLHGLHDPWGLAPRHCVRANPKLTSEGATTVLPYNDDCRCVCAPPSDMTHSRRMRYGQPLLCGLHVFARLATRHCVHMVDWASFMLVVVLVVLPCAALQCRLPLLACHPLKHNAQPPDEVRGNPEVGLHVFC